MVTQTPTPQTRLNQRALSLDALKGVIMIVMALDHVRSFFLQYDGVKEIWYEPAIYNPAPWDFWARYVSHPAAPGFFFLMGMGIVLLAQSRAKVGWDANFISRNLAIRGFILIALQFIAEDVAWMLRSGDPWRLVSTGVLSTLGASMMVSSILWRLKPWMVAAISAACLLGSSFLILSLGMENGNFSLLERLLVVAGEFGPVKVNYPLIPWIGVTGLGMVYGWYWLSDQRRGYSTSLFIGLALVLLFIGMRLAENGLWNLRPQIDDSFWAFMQATKYPPALSWLSLQLGICLILIWLFWKSEIMIERALTILLIFGRSPLFFYVAHLFLYASLSMFVFNEHTTIASSAAFWWVVGLLLLWPLCKWYGDFKGRQKPGSVWRYF